MTDAFRGSKPSRRDVLALMAGAGGALGSSLLWPETSWADNLDPRVAQIVSSSIAVDMHNHTPVGSSGEGHADPADVSATSFASELKRAGLTVACHTYAVDNLLNTSTPGEYYKLHLENSRRKTVCWRRKKCAALST